MDGTIRRQTFQFLAWFGYATLAFPLIRLRVRFHFARARPSEAREYIGAARIIGWMNSFWTRHGEKSARGL